MSPLLKRLGLLLFSLFTMASCASGPQSQALSHVFEEKSRMYIMTVRNFPNQPQARLRVRDKRRGWESHKTMKEGEFEAMWSLFEADDLHRFHVANPGPAIINLRENYVFYLGDVSAPTDGGRYIVPVSQAPPSVKSLADAMRNYGRPPKSKSAR